MLRTVTSIVPLKKCRICMGHLESIFHWPIKKLRSVMIQTFHCKLKYEPWPVFQYNYQSFWEIHLNAISLVCIFILKNDANTNDIQVVIKYLTVSTWSLRPSIKSVESKKVLHFHSTGQLSPEMKRLSPTAFPIKQTVTSFYKWSHPSSYHRVTCYLFTIQGKKVLSLNSMNRLSPAAFPMKQNVPFFDKLPHPSSHHRA